MRSKQDTKNSTRFDNLNLVFVVRVHSDLRREGWVIGKIIGERSAG